MGRLPNLDVLEGEAPGLSDEEAQEEEPAAGSAISAAVAIRGADGRGSRREITEPKAPGEEGQEEHGAPHRVATRSR